MTPEAARAHNLSHGFIDRGLSQTILKEIASSTKAPPSAPYQPEINLDLEMLHRRYWEIRNSIPSLQCRNLPFYLMIREKYADFRWHISDDGVVIDYHYKGLKPSLLSLLMERVPHYTARPADPLDRLLPDIAAEIRVVFHEVGIVAPEKAQLEKLALWLRKGLDGETLTIVSPVCPDYAVEPINETEEAAGNGPDRRVRARRHRFTFAGLGEDIGVTAAHLFQAAPRLHALLCERLGLDVRYLVAPGDFEGFSDETCQRLGVDDATFLRKVAAQARTIQQRAPIAVASHPFTDLCGGRQGWMMRWKEMLLRIRDGDLSAIGREPWVRATALGRRELYDRWYGCKNREDGFYLDIALRQAAEYAAMGQIVAASKDLQNPLILGADDHKMGRFYSIASEIPVLYLQRNYE
ncbi:hypothetical protein GGQ73_000386 [Rhizobium skierniewicense]|uniref:Uncharacterized protein n=1 Tax=Rhizobium skierniewicense TaxID=984260 RepID=A0A7W6G031_9HYPH|nr:hypothetical protein [Rhizobium skierniewicense]MBB3944463.1 hypothetical protein [Rhizobium skierniewicense]